MRQLPISRAQIDRTRRYTTCNILPWSAEVAISLLAECARVKRIMLAVMSLLLQRGIKVDEVDVRSPLQVYVAV